MTITLLLLSFDIFIVLLACSLNVMGRTRHIVCLGKERKRLYLMNAGKPDTLFPQKTRQALLKEKKKTGFSRRISLYGLNHYANRQSPHKSELFTNSTKHVFRYQKKKTSFLLDGAPVSFISNSQRHSQTRLIRSIFLLINMS